MPYYDIVYSQDPATGFVVFDSNGFPVQDPAANAGLAATNTYGNLQAKIQDEVLGSPTTAQIQNAIQDAIAYFEGMTFWFNNIRYFGASAGSTSNLQTVAGQEIYSSQQVPILGNMPAIKNIMIYAFGNRYPLRSRTDEWIDDQSVSQSWEGLPTDYCISGGTSIRLYPIPNGVYSLTLIGTVRLPALVSLTDYGVWTNRAEGLIRQEAKRNLFMNITRNPTQVAAMESDLYGNPNIGRQGLLARLRRESQTRLGTGGGGKVRASRGHM